MKTFTRRWSFFIFFFFSSMRVGDVQSNSPTLNSGHISLGVKIAKPFVCVFFPVLIFFIQLFVFLAFLCLFLCRLLSVRYYTVFTTHPVTTVCEDDRRRGLKRAAKTRLARMRHEVPSRNLHSRSKKRLCTFLVPCMGAFA